MKSHVLVRLLTLLACVPTAWAQSPEIPFPLDPAPALAGPNITDVPEILGGLVMKPIADRIDALERYSSVVMHGVPLPGGSGGALVDLELERIHVDRYKFGFRVNGVARPDLLDGLALSVWTGSVVGHPDSRVMLSFSRSGSRGWIQTDGALVHLMPRPDAAGDWSRGDVLLVTEESLNQRGIALDFTCEAKRPGGSGAETMRAPRTGAVTPPRAGGMTSAGATCGLRECKVALEGDWQLYQKFNNLAAETAYVTTLLSFTSNRYETQASTVLTFPYLNLWSTSVDGWDAQDTGGNCQAVLTELQATWVGNVPGGADLGHLMSGANLGCGVAWLDVLCDDQYNFSVSGNINGLLPFPVQVGPTNWDFIVVTHEIGHNFNAIHTHDYCPPVDECAPSGYFGACQSSQVCTNQGTVMSYCHLCAGGTSNITTFFHSASSADMTAAAALCLPAYVSIDGTTPAVLTPNVATPVTVQISGTPVGGVTLFYRYAGGSYTGLAMTDQGAGLHAASLPAAGCSATPEFYYSFTDASCGSVTDPADAPNTVYTALVGTPNGVLTDNFENDLGWTETILGATSGQWQRGVPVNASDWDYDPAADFDGSGKCWLTQNATGNTDVDGGAVQLLSPAFSLSGGPALISYAYYLRLTNSDGADRLLVEASSNGTGGPWVEVARHDTNGGSAWRTHVIDAADLAAAGVAQTANMRLRFTANDGGAASIVEAAIDAFSASVLSCSGLGTNYCTPASNSTGQPSLMSATGSASVAANNLVFHTAPVPTTTSGVVFLGSSQAYVPLGNGFRCVAGTLYRLPATQTTNGQLQFNLNNSVPPVLGHIVSGSTWNFQTWYRDVPAGGAQFNLSDGYQVVFGP